MKYKMPTGILEKRLRFTPHYETVESLQKRLGQLYEQVELEIESKRSDFSGSEQPGCFTWQAYIDKYLQHITNF